MRFLVIFLGVFFCSCNAKVETLKIKGSDTEVNLAVLLAEQFHKENSEILVSICGGGSGLGIASLLNGNADIANSSRSMKAEEFDAKFEAGEDLTALMDFSTARRPNQKKQAIELKLPLWMIHQLEAEAQKQGISPQAFLENYLHENLTPAQR
jgi:ABC-type phosphate transport system substrate-binding protein